MGMPKLLYEKTIIGKKKRLFLFGAFDFCFCEEEDSVVREMEKIWSRRGLLLLISICIFGWGPCSTSGSTDPADTAALKNLYSSLNSPSWLSQWSLNSDDPCGQSWQGVTCSGSRVTQIVLSGLGLSGSLGFQLTSLTSVVNFDMSNNNLEGRISYQLPPNLQRLNLARNRFNRDIPYSVSTMTSLKYLNVSYNQLHDLYANFGQLSSLSTLDLSFNSFSSNLPESCSSLSSMSTMYLQNNQFNGTINVLTNLPLQHLNIENNRFTGWIPERLKNINMQKDGNFFSSGPAPPPPPYWPPSNQYNNADRNHNDNHNHNQNQNQSDGGGKSGIGGGGIAGIVISLLLVGGIAAFFLMKRRSRSSSDIEKLNDQPFAPLSSDEVREMKSVQTPSSLDTKTFDTSARTNLMPPPIDRHKSLDEEEFSNKAIAVKKKASAIHLDVKSFSVADLQMATNSFSVDNLLGEGSFGRVYRAQFDGKVLAVKKIDSYILPEESSEDFSEIVSKVSQLHHPNVTELVGYCSEHGQHLLVYEFHKNGSLHNFLHFPDEHSKTLTWSCRVNISLGTARALEYLHEVCSPSIVHRNIKSTNILLDSELNPHISDSGLASCMPNIEQVLDHDNAESGYSAPEVTMSGQYTLKSDVYSFGVVMLELLSGREPFDSSRPRSEQSLVQWAAPQLHDIDALGKMVDPALRGLYSVTSLSRFADVIALCVQPEPEFRPPMSEVVQALVRLVQRAYMSKRTIGRVSFRGDNPESEERS